MALSAPRRKTYIETFDDGPGGWVANQNEPLQVWDGVAYCYGPWYLDANHAPPGAGYLHMLMYLHTKARHVGPYGKPNRFVDGGYSRDLTNAKLTLRLRGVLEDKGARLCLLVQAEGPNNSWPRPNYTLTGQPFTITREWSEQSIVLSPDAAQWTYMGARHDLAAKYGSDLDIGTVLRDVSVDLILVLFPLTVVPVGEVDDMHRRWAGREYQPDIRHLPRGLIMIDTISIEYPD